MTETIPADVMAEAQKQTAWLRDNEEEHGELHDRVISLVIARAILSERDRATAAERERAANIAEWHFPRPNITDAAVSGRHHSKPANLLNQAGKHIAAAIRNPMEGRG